MEIETGENVEVEVEVETEVDCEVETETEIEVIIEETETGTGENVEVEVDVCDSVPDIDVNIDFDVKLNVDCAGDSSGCGADDICNDQSGVKYTFNPLSTQKYFMRFGIRFYFAQLLKTLKNNLFWKHFGQKKMKKSSSSLRKLPNLFLAQNSPSLRNPNLRGLLKFAAFPILAKKVFSLGHFTGKRLRNIQKIE